MEKKNLAKTKRIVIKIGSSLLTRAGKTDYKKIKKYAKDNPAIDVFAQHLIDISTCGRC